MPILHAVPRAMTLALFIGFAIGFLLGSIPFGVILTRMAGLTDLRKIGSGNIGATNVLRTGHKGLAAATLVLDGLKGTLAALAAAFIVPRLTRIGVEGEARFLLLNGLGWGGALGAVLGHMFPPWLGFRGGKGVATFIGGLIAMNWPIAAVFGVIWVAVAAIWRFSSLAALVATAAIVAYYWILAPFSTGSIAVLLMALLIYYKHRENISRLLTGHESHIGAKGWKARCRSRQPPCRRPRSTTGSVWRACV
jgi:glycerol-3-phosphate acyltransferase PlsY